MKILFEDNKDSPICRLLSQSPVGKYIVFSSGNRRLVSAIRRFSNEPIICYVDMVWDNPRTEDLYTELLALKARRRDLFVFRTPCLEFYTIMWLEMISVYDFKDKANVLRYIMYGGDAVKVTYSSKSLEKYCKGVLREARKQCLREAFFIKSCWCGYTHCSLELNIYYKALGIVLMFPGIAELSEIRSVLLYYDIDSVEYPEDVEVYSRMWHCLYD